MLKEPFLGIWNWRVKRLKIEKKKPLVSRVANLADLAIAQWAVILNPLRKLIPFVIIRLKIKIPSSECQLWFFSLGIPRGGTIWLLKCRFIVYFPQFLMYMQTVMIGIRLSSYTLITYHLFPTVYLPICTFVVMGHGSEFEVRDLFWDYATSLKVFTPETSNIMNFLCTINFEGTNNVNSILITF